MIKDDTELVKLRALPRVIEIQEEYPLPPPPPHLQTLYICIII